MLITSPGFGPGSKGLQAPTSAKFSLCSLWITLITPCREPIASSRTDSRSGSGVTEKSSEKRTAVVLVGSSKKVVCIKRPLYQDKADVAQLDHISIIQDVIQLAHIYPVIIL